MNENKGYEFYSEIHVVFVVCLFIFAVVLIDLFVPVIKENSRFKNLFLQKRSSFIMLT